MDILKDGAGFDSVIRNTNSGDILLKPITNMILSDHMAIHSWYAYNRNRILLKPSVRRKIHPVAK